eukprot:scaffold20944_cov106-Isochrysis_galbana.AAC.2
MRPKGQSPANSRGAVQKHQVACGDSFVRVTSRECTCAHLAMRLDPAVARTVLLFRQPRLRFSNQQLQPLRLLDQSLRLKRHLAHSREACLQGTRASAIVWSSGRNDGESALSPGIRAGHARRANREAPSRGSRNIFGTPSTAAPGSPAPCPGAPRAAQPAEP